MEPKAKLLDENVNPLLWHSNYVIHISFNSIGASLQGFNEYVE